MKKYLLLFLSALPCIFSFAQSKPGNGSTARILSENEWVDSIFNSLTNDERVAQLIIIRVYPNDTGTMKTADLITDYKVGGLCFFQGGPLRQAFQTNYFQSISKTPLFISIDAEYGLGMRLDSVLKFPYQLTLGALRDPSIIYEMGKAVGEQCKRIGININYAPVVDVNNNPDNPVIGFRSFGEDKNKVAQFALAYMKGMQDAGIMACAKHFPGHGDVNVDSHLDLPIITKSIEQLDTVELKPFEALFAAGVSSVMSAHLYIPAIDTAANMATSLSKNSVTTLLRKNLGFKGLAFTDALEMKGVSKYWPAGEAAAQALVAGNDMLCLPESVPDAIAAIKKAVDDKRISWQEIDARVERVLHAKYRAGLNKWKRVDTLNLLKDLNAKTEEIRLRVARQTITVVKTKITKYFSTPRLACVVIGAPTPNNFAMALHERRNAEVYTFSYKDDAAQAASIIERLKVGQYDEVIVSVGGYSLRPGNNYGISEAAINFYNQLQQFNSKNYIFGNVLAIKNFLFGDNVIACYQDDDVTQISAADYYGGAFVAKGTLPVSVGMYKFGNAAFTPLPNATYNKFYRVDSIVSDGLDKGAFPGCVVLGAKDGKVVYERAYGHYQYDPASPFVSPTSIFDLASVTKISATNISIMKLYDEGKVKLDKTLGDYLPWTKNTDKAHLKIKDILLHQAGLVPFISFYRETIDSLGDPNPAIYSSVEKQDYSVRVADRLYLRNDWEDSLWQRILTSPLGAAHKYVYSDNDFIFLGKIVQSVSGMPLEDYVQKTFYEPMGATTTGFRPRNRFPQLRIVPTEDEYQHFRRQLLWGDVHDEGSSMFGEVAGHAGLFSDAEDLLKIYQMLLNGGVLDGKRYLRAKTISLFTAYHSEISRRGYGFDKPEKDNATSKDPYPSALASPETFGHTGYTGTCVWVDPKYNIVYIFFSNRVNPTRNNSKLSDLRIRGKIQDEIYRVLLK